MHLLLAANGGPKDPQFSKVSGLFHFDGSLVDASSNHNNLSLNGGTLSYATGKIGQSLVLASSSARAANSPLYYFGSGDFTVECWASFVANIPQGAYIASVWTDSGTSKCWALWGTSTSSAVTITFYYSKDGTNNITITGGSFPINTLTHVAVTRTGGVITLWVNGSNVGTHSEAGTMFNSTASFMVGGASNLTNNSTISVDELRITKGFARYTSNFVPQTTPFPNQ